MAVQLAILMMGALQTAALAITNAKVVAAHLLVSAVTHLNSVVSTQQLNFVNATAIISSQIKFATPA